MAVSVYWLVKTQWRLENENPDLDNKKSLFALSWVWYGFIILWICGPLRICLWLEAPSCFFQQPFLTNFFSTLRKFHYVSDKTKEEPRAASRESGAAEPMLRDRTKFRASTPAQGPATGNMRRKGGRILSCAFQAWAWSFLRRKSVRSFLLSPQSEGGSFSHLHWGSEFEMV